MNVLELSRWQFGVTTVYHFLFVPVSIGLAFLVAGFELAWLRARSKSRPGADRWLKLTRFYGKLLLINFAMGVVTGIVQEFQFGMNWSRYSRYVGDIFGAPLAIEALLAFFLESTFLGLWIFGWDRLPAWLHNACMWIVATGTALSAYFILVANSWMQHPVGYRYNPAAHRDELTSFWALLSNPMQLVTFPHVLAACFLTGGALVAAVAAWHLIRGTSDEDRLAWRYGLKAGAITVLIAAIGTLASGDVQGKLLTRYQPMKVAAAEALYHTSTPAPFSLLTIGNLHATQPVFQITLPRLLSFLATGNWSSTVQGIDNLQAQYVHQYGSGSYIPMVPVAYWGFRLMIGTGMAAALIALVTLWAARRGRIPGAGWPRWLSRPLLWAVLVLPVLPLAANSLGWVFTETGRQPWLVYGQLKTAAGVSANSGGEVLTSLITFTVLYGVLAVIEAGLMLSAARARLAAGEPGDAAGHPGLVY